MYTSLGLAGGHVHRNLNTPKSKVRVWRGIKKALEQLPECHTTQRERERERRERERELY
jgi:hypothetical protein